jgi:predicted enzyme related to lactoylglutathione lyase
MSNTFVWFHNSSEKPQDSSAFYEKLLGWKPSEGPGGMTMLAGANGPFAGVGDKQGNINGWIPYAQVDDVDAATTKAQGLGATVLEPKTRGPAGEFSIVRDPGGAAIALWQKA